MNVLKCLKIAVITISSFSSLSADAHGPAVEDTVRAVTLNQQGSTPKNVMDAMVDAYQLWSVPQTLRFCFFDGTREAKDFFIDAAKVWDDLAEGLVFDFGSTTTYRACSSESAHVRVSFADNGNWSYVGQTSAVQVAQTEVSLNVGSMPKGPFDLKTPERLESIRGTVLHEIGHALAMLHEHQSPDAGCDDEIIWDAAYAYYGRFGWDKDKINYNVRGLTSEPRLRYTEFDPASIQMYYLPASILKQGAASTCFSHQNTTLSSSDREIIASMYPATSVEQALFVEKLDLAAAAYAETLPPEKKEALEQAINETAPDHIKDARGGSLSIGAIIARRAFIGNQIEVKGDQAIIGGEVNGDVVGGNKVMNQGDTIISESGSISSKGHGNTQTIIKSD